MELQDKVAIVTGGSSGIGKAIAKRFVEEGARVVILGRSDEAGKQVEAELQAIAKIHGIADCLYIHADVSDSNQVQEALSDVIERWHQIHIVINNAALMKTGPLIEMDEADWDKTMAVNLRGPFLLAKYAMPAMPPHGAIVNISSVHAIATDDQSAAYSASKGGLETLTRALALECYPKQVRVNALRLGAIDTGMLWENPAVKSGEEKIDPHEVGTPEDIAEIALFCVSPKSRFISGAVIMADGGRLPILSSHTD
jgi:NAD(P)-dependent dehydrogenase (short-subunit alcohol dehydrogenase family)